MKSILIDKYHNIVNQITNRKSVNMDEFVFLLASGEENGFVDEYGYDVIPKSEGDFIKCLLDPNTDNYTSWVKIGDWVYIDIHAPHELPNAIKVFIRDIETLCGADPVEYKFLRYTCEWV